MAFYIDGRYLGEDSDEAVEKLSRNECWNVAYDYLMQDFSQEDLVTFVLDLQVLPKTSHYAMDALENIINLAGEGEHVSYAGVEWIDDSDSMNLRPQRSRTSAKKAPVKKASKPKASNARKPKAPAKKKTAARSTGRRY